MNGRIPGNKSVWHKTPYANLVRYEPSGKYFARVRVRGKLIRRSLKTTQLGVAKLRLNDLEKVERQRAGHQTAVAEGRMAFGDALAIYRQRLHGNASLKPGSKRYVEQRMAALVNSWPGLAQRDVRRITKQDCLGWAAGFVRRAAASSFNNTAATLRLILEIAVEAGGIYDNPARFIKRVRVLPKKLQLPGQDEFLRLVETIEQAERVRGGGSGALVRFLAYGGFRRSEAANITWADCDWEKKEITVRGDPVTGTKNWSTRRVPMIPDMVELLGRLRRGRAGEPESARVMTVINCIEAMDAACRKLGLARITHHDLRHLFATRCIESGVDIPTVSRWLGHKDGGALAMKVYGHLRDQHSVAMAQRVTFGKNSGEKIISLAQNVASN
jgi:integrase